MLVTLDAVHQSQVGDVYELDQDVVITYGDRTLYADKVTYNSGSGDVSLEGHVKVVGGRNEEHIEASHGNYNLNDETGHFYDASGSVQLRVLAPAAPVTTTASVVGPAVAPQRRPYLNANPFLFRGREIVKTGPSDYVIYDGWVTSCLMPHPDWQLYSGKFTMQDGTARAGATTFRLLGVPILFLPYVSHPADATTRTSGLLVPVFSYSSASNDTGSKGLTIGEQVYLVINRETDLTLGSIYYSLRGFSENGTVRYKGPGDDFLTAHFSALQDRGFDQPTVVRINPRTLQPVIQNVHVNQGGQDLTTTFRYRFTPYTRGVGDAEYLSSYIYREAFTENFNQAVSSDITSILFLTHEKDGWATDVHVDRYQGLKVVPVGITPGQEVKIFHAPSLNFSGIDRKIPGTPLVYHVDSSAAGMKRVQPNFVTSGMTERVDVRPEVSLPLHFEGWNIVASAAVRETFYSRSRRVPYSIVTGANGPNAVPVEISNDLNRASFELNVDIRPPAIERTFEVPKPLQNLLGEEVRHTIEPEITYRNVHGVDNFLSILRFDDADLVSDTDELRYGVLQHLYFRPKKQKERPGCSAEGVAVAEQEWEDELKPLPGNDANGIPNADFTMPDDPTRTHMRRNDPCAATGPAPQQEWFSWELAQKTFFAQNFGGAVINQRRNIFESTLNFSGIAFLTEAREISPTISRMRFRTSGHTDVEWDFDYDTGAKKFNSQNAFLDVHEGSWFGGFSYARLNAPGRFLTEKIDTVTNVVTGITSSATSDFSQMRLLLGYGAPSKAGLSVAGGAGIDLKQGDAQYVTLQTSYNWNCCGLAVEYRKYDLGTIRNEGTYSFNFTLANIGSAGNLRRNQSLF
jgi:LPS-assembly protein